MRRHEVTFLSPGTLFHEYSTRTIEAWNAAVASEMAKEICERYNAKPFAFQFLTVLVADPVPDGEGGFLEVTPKRVEQSGLYFLGGVLVTLDELESKNDKNDRTLIGNMRCNDWPIVIFNTNSWKVVQPYNENDCIVVDGHIIDRGDDQKHKDYREKTIARVKLERGY